MDLEETNDPEVRAILANKKLMAYLDESAQKAIQGPRKSLQQLRKEFNIPAGSSKLRASSR
jgi:hypothetical protein